MSAQGSGYVGGACRRQGYGKKGRAHRSQESWQSTRDGRRLGRHDDGPVMVKEQRVDACVENPKVTRERSRASALAFQRRGIRGWGEVAMLCVHESQPPVGSAGVPRDPDGQSSRAGRWWALSPIVPLWRRWHTFSDVGIPKHPSLPALQGGILEHGTAQRGRRCKLMALNGGDACRPPGESC